MESNPPSDCFAQFDKAFAEWAEWSAELQQGEVEPNPQAVKRPAPSAEPYSAEDYAAFDRIDVLLAQAAPVTEEPVRTTPHVEAPLPPGPAIVQAAFELCQLRADDATPIERMLGAVENLTLIRDVLERDGLTASARAALVRVLDDVSALCEECDFATAAVRVKFAAEDLAGGRGDLKHDLSELVRHLRHDARSWAPVAQKQPRSRRQHSNAVPADEVAVAADRKRR